MGIEIGIEQILNAVRSLGLSVPAWVVLMLAALAFAKWLGILDWFFDLIVRGIKATGRVLYNRETREFVRIRNRFVEHLIYEVERLNREADWNDFHYTALEAEVEVDLALDLDMSHSKLVVVWLRLLRSLPRAIFRISPSGGLEKNLVKAIMRSKSRAFMVIGDPGSGKTVSLRHLFLRMAKRCSISRDRTATVPLYLNLKTLNVPPEDVTADKVHDWVIEELRAGQDRSIHEFLDINFERMLEQGAFFFLFDSFDEIPAVMDAQEGEEVVRQYAEALDRFLHSPHACRGLIASRSYRAPKVFVGQRMTIRPLSNRRIRDALDKYMIQSSMLAKQLWSELVQRRDDLLHISRNPFYLNLLARYAKERRRLPDRQYDLFEHFVQTRAGTDEERLAYFGLSPEALVEKASFLAFAMTQTPHIALEADGDQVRTILRRLDGCNDWAPDQVRQLLDALCYSKLGRMSQGEPGSPNVFSFVHRRFHEYFCARYLRDHPQIAPVENLVADNRWREVLVLLCEVLSSEQLIGIFDVSRSALSAGVGAVPGSLEHRTAIETLRFLKDGFRSRLADLPDDIRELCSAFIKEQLEEGNLLDQKRAIECIALADDDSASLLLEFTLSSDSPWLRETGIRSCRVLKSLAPRVAEAIRKHLYHRYTRLQVHRDASLYSILFSSPPSLLPLRSFLRILVFVSLCQIILCVGIAGYGILFDSRFLLGLLFSAVFVFEVKVLEFLRPLMRVRLYPAFDKVNRRLGWMTWIVGWMREWDIKMMRFYPWITHWARRLMRTLENPWVVVSLGLVVPAIVSDGQGLSGRPRLRWSGTDAWLFLVLATVLLFINLLVARLVGNYPSSIRSWFLLPAREAVSVLRSMICAFWSAIRNWRSLWKEWVYGFVFVAGYMWVALACVLFLWSDRSISKLYQDYHFLLATIILFTVLLFTLIMLLMLSFALLIIRDLLLGLGQLVYDQIRLAILSIRSDARPQSVAESVCMLHSFKSEIAKAQYARALLKWLPVGTDLPVLVEEASQHEGDVRDALFQMIEVWEDSVPEAVQRSGGQVIPLAPAANMR